MHCIWHPKGNHTIGNCYTFNDRYIRKDSKGNTKEDNQKKMNTTTKTWDSKTSRQKEPGPSYIRVLFDKEPGYMLGKISMKDQSDFKTTLPLLVPNS